jgi:lipopolysaccharide transport system ATP-binding protein
MSEAIIQVENLGKCYRISHQAERQRYTALRDVIAEKAKGLFQKLKSGKPENLKSGNDISVSASQHSRVSSSEDFWALKDVSFEVKQGEVVGIIGRNGAGKSTLLKILSRITEPTEGRVTLRGRVASLLEVGTGFHPELTGRENIFLNGAILGMKRAEIRKKFDEIVAFAEVEKFLDTPVKRYSSGMYVRLAFAVAAHLEPEILIVDEVLAVGDATFQQKCLGKMQDVSANEGRTVLFVSHNESAVRNLCSRAILMEYGNVKIFGLVDEVFIAYKGGTQDSGFSSAKRTCKSDAIAILDAKLKNEGITVSDFISGSQPVLELTIRVVEETKFGIDLILRDMNSVPVMWSSKSLQTGQALHLDSGDYRVRFRIMLPELAEGKYSMDLMLGDPGKKLFDNIEEALVFHVLPTSFTSTGFVFRQGGQGCVILETKNDEIERIS